MKQKVSYCKLCKIVEISFEWNASQKCEKCGKKLSSNKEKKTNGNKMKKLQGTYKFTQYAKNMIKNSKPGEPMSTYLSIINDTFKCFKRSNGGIGIYGFDDNSKKEYLTCIKDIDNFLEKTTEPKYVKFLQKLKKIE